MFTAGLLAGVLIGAVGGGLLVFVLICVLFAGEAQKGPWQDGGVRA